MTSPHLTGSVRHVLQAAMLAPSVHNSQPWRFEVRPDGFDLHPDAGRALPVLDPTGRQMHVSCGAALETARVAARALGLDAAVELLPSGDSGPLARCTLSGGAPAKDREIALALAVLRRHTVRERFEDREVPQQVVDGLRAAAEQHGAALRVVAGESDLVSLTVLLSGADAAEERDPDYRRELASWVREGVDDGVPVSALPHGTARGSSLRQRDFTLSSLQHGDDSAPRAERPLVVVLTTPADRRRDWLLAGQALGAVLLHAASCGVQAQPLNQVVDLPGPRWALRQALGLTGVPQMVLRAGYARPVAATPRRDLDDSVV